MKAGGGVPVECQQLVEELKDSASKEISDHLRERLVEVFTLKGNSKRPVLWHGPFAWSVLMAVNSHSQLTEEQAEVVGQVVWLCCKRVHELEKHLTLWKCDFEKLVCNLSTKFLKAQQYKWACYLTSFLYERLRITLFDPKAETLEVFDRLRLGREFLSTTPRFRFEKLEPVDTILVLILNCHSLWLRLLIAFKQSSAVNLISMSLFGDGGMLELISMFGGKSEQIVELFLYNWRLAFCDALSSKVDWGVGRLVEFELEIFKELSRQKCIDEGKLGLIRWKNICLYVSVNVECVELQRLVTFDLACVKNGDEYLSKLASLSKSVLLALIEWPSISPDVKSIVRMVSAIKYQELPIPGGSSGGHSFCSFPKISIASSVELWISQQGGRFLSKEFSGTQQNIRVIWVFLNFTNSLVAIRHEVTMRLIDGCIRFIAMNWNEDSQPEVFKLSIHCLLKLAQHFSKMDAATMTLFTVIKVLAEGHHFDMAQSILTILCHSNTFYIMNETFYGGENVKAPLPSSLKTSLNNKNDQNLPCRKVMIPILSADQLCKFAETWANITIKILKRESWEFVVFPSDLELLKKVINYLLFKFTNASMILGKICDQSSSLKVIITCHLSMLSSRAASKFANEWISRAEQINADDCTMAEKLFTTISLKLFWKFLLKLPIESVIDELFKSINNLKEQEEDGEGEGGDDGPFINDCPELFETLNVLLRMLGYSNLVLRLGRYSQSVKFELLIEAGDPFSAKSLLEHSHSHSNSDLHSHSMIELAGEGFDTDILGELSPFYTSRAAYLKGNFLEAYCSGKDYFDSIILTIKSGKLTLKELWENYHQLLKVIEWLFYLCDVGGSWRLAKFYVKAGITYSESIGTTRRRSIFLMYQSKVLQSCAEPIDFQIPTYSLLPFSPFIDDLAGLDHPPCIMMIYDWINAKLYALSSKFGKEEWPIEALNFTLLSNNSKRSLKDGKSDTGYDLDKILYFAYKCGSSEQFRLAACLKLRQMDNVDRMMALIRSVQVKDLFSFNIKSELPLLSLDLDSDLDSDVALDNKDKNNNDERGTFRICMFIDPYWNFFYVKCSWCQILSKAGPMMVRIRLPHVFKEFSKALNDIIEENKKALFEPGKLPPPTDEVSKRNWWQGRFDLEGCFERFSHSINDWLVLVEPFLVSLNMMKDSIIIPCSLGSVTVPDEICLPRLIGAIRESPSLTKDKTEEFLRCLKFSVKDVKLLSEYFDGAKRTNDEMEEYNNPFTIELPRRQLVILELDKYLHSFPWEACESFKRFLIVRSLCWPPPCNADEGNGKGSGGGGGGDGDGDGGAETDNDKHNDTDADGNTDKEKEKGRGKNDKLEDNCKNKTYHQPRGKKMNGISAILNPSGDLKRTEEFLSPLLESICEKDSIICGRAPSSEEMREMFINNDLVLYFGHGSGESYLSAFEISLLPSCASTFLFGCSSGRLRIHGRYNPEGALVSFLSCKSPLMLVNLWDVTDRDIDKLTKVFLTSLKLYKSSPSSIDERDLKDYSSALEESRKACLLRLLNGAAPVLYIS